jgi:hypothetical protein
LLPHMRTTVWLPIALTCRIHYGTRYQDTYRTPLCHYILAITPLFLQALPQTHHYRALWMPTDLLPIALTCRICHGTQYQDTYRTIISLLLLLYSSMHNTRLITITPCQHQWTCYHIHAPLLQHWNCSLFRLYWRTALSAELNIGICSFTCYYKQIRPIADDPDLRPRLFLAALPCTALGYQRAPLQILVIQSHSRHGIQTAMPVTIIGLAILASWMEFSVG